MFNPPPVVAEIDADDDNIDLDEDEDDEGIGFFYTRHTQQSTLVLCWCSLSVPALCISMKLARMMVPIGGNASELSELVPERFG